MALGRMATRRLLGSARPQGHPSKSAAFISVGGSPSETTHIADVGVLDSKQDIGKKINRGKFRDGVLDPMLRGNRHYILTSGLVIFIALAAAAWVGQRLQPEKPRLTGERGFQEIDRAYQAGGAGCNPARINALIGQTAEREKDRCQDAKEQHREAANGLIESRRQADAADASAIAAYEQTKIAGWGVGLGFVTMVAAILAALFAERAAHYTKKSQMAFVEAEKPRLIISLDGFNVVDDILKFSVFATNVGSGGCVVSNVSGAWSKSGEKSEIYLGTTCSVAIAPGDTKAIKFEAISTKQLANDIELEGLIKFDGPFLDEVPTLQRFRFKVFPSIAYPNLNWYIPISVA